MKQFALCPECEREYRDPRDRRFHAQPNACPKCGPHLELWDANGAVLATHHPALLLAAKTIRDGKILALKGLGGFQFIVDARNEDAVRRLRQRKQREEKPFAVMFPSLQAVSANCRVSAAEARLLESPESPIVLLPRLAAPTRPIPGDWVERATRPSRRATGPAEQPPAGFECQCEATALAPSVAPANPNLGVMLPYSPLHHLLMADLNFPVVATSGNLSDEPICIDEHDALQRLRHIADLFLVHNRPIVRHVDDSVVRLVLGREQVLRRARGYAPLPLPLAAGRPAAIPDNAPPVLAVGGHLKNAVALALGPQVFVSQHIGDLETVQSYDAFLRVIHDFQRLYEAEPRWIAHDAHPGYLSTQFATAFAAGKAGARAISVQHHVAHVLACAAENELAPPLLGVSWDGTGHGLDGTVWGGEFFVLTDTACRRLAHFRQFRLPGGEQAIKEPRRAALGMLYELFGESALAAGNLAPMPSFAAADLPALIAMLKRGVNSPLTSSAGRLFDAVAALLGLRQIVRFEGQAAMELEFAIAGFNTDGVYPFEILGQDKTAGEPLLVADWGPMLKDILADSKRGHPAGLISAKFHNTLAEIIVAVAQRAALPQVVLSGGCFQNRYLTERTAARLAQEGFRPYWHQRVPPNDGGLALGQIVATLMGVE